MSDGSATIHTVQAQVSELETKNADLLVAVLEAQTENAYLSARVKKLEELVNLYWKARKWVEEQ